MSARSKKVKLSHFKKADFSKKILLVGESAYAKYVNASFTRMAAEAPLPVYREQESTVVTSGISDIARYFCGMGIAVDVLTIVGSSNGIEMKNIDKSLAYHLIKCDGYEPEITTIYTCGDPSSKLNDIKNGVLFQSVQPSLLKNKTLFESSIIKKYTEMLGSDKYSAVVLVDKTDGFFSENICQNILQKAHLYKTTTISDGEKTRDFDYSFCDKLVKVTSLEDMPKQDTNGIGGMVSHGHFDSVFVYNDNSIILLESGITKETISIVCKRLDNSKKMSILMTLIASGLIFKQSSSESLQNAVKYLNILDEKKLDEHFSVIDLIQYNVITNTSDLRLLRRFIPADKSVVVTTGCFDLLHAGHIDGLKIAKQMGDILIVLLNSDSSIKRLKGSSRPVYNEEERLILLSAIKFIDFVVVFDGSIPYEEMKIIDPDVLVKGNEYTEDFIRKHYPCVKKIRTIPRKGNVSTTQTIELIKHL